jgi:hypothetical protein
VVKNSHKTNPTNFGQDSSIEDTPHTEVEFLQGGIAARIRRGITIESLASKVFTPAVIVSALAAAANFLNVVRPCSGTTAWCG